MNAAFTRRTASVFLLTCFVFGVLSCLATSYTWNGGSGDWSVAANWTPGSGPPGAGDTATVNSGTVTVSSDVSVANLTLSAATINGTGTLTVTGVMNWLSGGTMSGSGVTLIAPGATVNASGNVSMTLGRRLENAGLMVQTGAAGIYAYSGSVVSNRAGSVWEIRNDQVFDPGGASGRFDNAGLLRKTNSTGTTIFDMPLNNYGTVKVESGTLHARNGAFTNYGTMEVRSGTLQITVAYAQYSGLTLLAGGNIVNSSPLQIVGGFLSGVGTISGGVNNIGGEVSPGASPGLLTVTGNYSQSAGGKLNIEIAGTAPGTTFDKLAVGGTATLNGALNVDLVGGYYPAPSLTYTVLTASVRSGVFGSFYYPSNDVGLAISNTANSVYVKVINVRPNVPFIGSQTNNEEVLFSLGVNATDDDTPAQTLTYTLTNAPAGASVNPSGQITWTPTEAQGPMTTNITVRVTDNGTPNLSVSRTFPIIANEVNVAPVLTFPPNQMVDEQTSYTNSAIATDQDIPINTPLIFELVSGPPGLTVGSDGFISWSPNEAHGSNVYNVTIRVTDTNEFAVNEKQLSTTNNFTLTVREVNLSPSLIVPGDQVLTEETPLSVSASATDPDLPTNGLSFTLLSPPAGMTIDGGSGAISWTPEESQGSNSYTITVVVTDDSPMAVNAIHLSVTNNFLVTVNESNRPPVLTVPADQVITEETPLSVPASATDPDVPANPRSFALVSPPSGMTIDSGSGMISWTPEESQGSNSFTITVTVTDTNQMAINTSSFTVTNNFLVTVNESNRPPVLTVPGPQILNELTTLMVTNTAADPDIPANTLVFALISPPVGMTIDAASGVINWIPTEAQGSNTYTITVSVTDTNANAINATSLSDTKSFVVTVNESNSPPVLTLPTNTNINELVAFSASATASDPDIPANPLKFALVSGPAGLTVSPSGLINWTPDETQGPTTNTVFISLTDTNLAAVNATSLSVTGSFEIVVNEVNVAPALGALSHYTVNAGQTASFTATATDADLPTNTLSFSLIGAPEGATIDPATGLFQWRPGVIRADTTNTMQVRVQDNGSPVMSDTGSFSIVVNPISGGVILTPLGYSNGVFRVGVTGPLGPDYVILASTNLAQWTALATNLSPVTPFQFIDSAAGSFNNRAYRVQLSP